MADPTSSGQHLLMKDQSKIKRSHRRTTVILNSRDRNLVSYPSSAQYRFQFRRPLTNVLSVELMNGSVPAYIFNINVGWNSFTFKEFRDLYKVTLTPGFYTEAQLATELANRLNALPGIYNTYSASVSATTKTLTITRTAGSEAFWFLFASGDFKDEIDSRTYTVLSINTPARLLGFGINDYRDDGGSLTAPLPMDLENFGNRIYLHLNGDNNQSLHRMEMSSGRHDPYHIIFLSPGASNYIFLDKETYMPLYESSPAPIARMSGLEVAFRDEFNRLIDFQGREVNLVFEITHLE